MEDAGVGWIAAIIIGGIAGWLAEQFMKNRARYRGGGDRQRYFELLRNRLGGMGWLPYFRLHWRGLADLDRPGRAAGLRTSRPTSKQKTLLAAV
jgi:hypothetical protein